MSGDSERHTVKPVYKDHSMSGGSERHTVKPVYKDHSMSGDSEHHTVKPVYKDRSMSGGSECYTVKPVYKDHSTSSHLCGSLAVTSPCMWDGDDKVGPRHQRIEVHNCKESLENIRAIECDHS